MRCPLLLALSACVFCCSFALAQDASVQTRADAPPAARVDKALDRYLAKENPAYEWSIESTEDLPGMTRLVVSLQSGTWQGSTWQHSIRMFRPKECQYPDSAIVLINGGSNLRSTGTQMDAACIALAGLSGMPVVALFQVPNQPLLGDRYEDALIAASWLKYLETDDESWPLLFPMVNSVVSTMDAVNEISTGKFDQPVTKYIVTGASKRGWTSWLSAAADKRIIGVAPMVIDMLNFNKQMQDQKTKWGFYSEQISDYTDAGLIHPEHESEAEARLRQMMDPYEYRERLTLPKLIINGSNDRYWRCDALAIYWDDLSGPKNVLTLANAGHSLKGGELQITRTMAQFARACVQHRQLPTVQWNTNIDEDTRLVEFEVQTSEAASKIGFWVATAPTRDFRSVEFVLQPTDSKAIEVKDRKHASIRINRPADQYIAVFADVTFGGLLDSYMLSTGISQPD